MEFRQLQHFLAVVETGSFHKAAAQVNITPQAISRSIQQLEKECGGRLLERKKGARHSVGPSPFGLLLLPRAHKALTELKVFRDELENLMGTGRAMVRLGATPTAVRSLLPAAIRAFRAKRPAVRVQVMHQVSHIVLEQLGSGLYEIAICDEPEERLDARFSAEPLYIDHNIFVARKDHQWIGAGRLELKALMDAEWAIVGPFCRMWNELRDIYSWAGLAPPRHSMESNSVEFCVQQLLNDDYVSFLPARLVSEELRSGRLVELPVRQPKPRSWSCLLVRRADSKPGASTAAFIDTLRWAAKKLPRI
jgi:LysR family transcriptional regulator of abg operon